MASLNGWVASRFQHLTLREPTQGLRGPPSLNLLSGLATWLWVGKFLVADYSASSNATNKV
jgi:hypothetical protein